MALNAFTQDTKVEAADALQMVRGRFTFTNAADYAAGGYAGVEAWLMQQLDKAVYVFDITGFEVGGKHLVWNAQTSKVMIFDKDGQVADGTNPNGLTFFTTITIR